MVRARSQLVRILADKRYIGEIVFGAASQDWHERPAVRGGRLLSSRREHLLPALRLRQRPPSPLAFNVSQSLFSFKRVRTDSLASPFSRPFTVPIDLILYRFLIPATIRAVDPRARINKLFSDWAKRTAHELRLTSFIFGTRVDSEEGTHVRRTWRARLTLKKADVTELEAEDEEHQPEVSPREVVFRKDGGWGRVPAVDTVRVVAGRTMLVRVTEDGQALDKEGAKIIVSQTVEMATSRPKDKYMIVRRFAFAALNSC